MVLKSIIFDNRQEDSSLVVVGYADISNSEYKFLKYV